MIPAQGVISISCFSLNPSVNNLISNCSLVSLAILKFVVYNLFRRRMSDDLANATFLTEHVTYSEMLCCLESFEGS